MIGPPTYVTCELGGPRPEVLLPDGSRLAYRSGWEAHRAAESKAKALSAYLHIEGLPEPPSGQPGPRPGGTKRRRHRPLRSRPSSP